MNDQSQMLLSGKRLIEESMVRWNTLSASLENCIKIARENFNICDNYGVDIEMENVQNCISKVDEASVKLCDRRDRLVSAHDDLIAVALDGEVRYRHLFAPDAEIPLELKNEKWKIEPCHCTLDSCVIQLEISELETVFVNVIHKSAEDLQSISVNLLKELLEGDSKSKHLIVNSKIILSLIKGLERVIIWAPKMKDIVDIFLNPVEQKPGNLLDHLRHILQIRLR